MNQGNLFQIVIVGVFIALGVAGIIFFALFRATPETEDYVGPVQIWGTIDASVMSAALESLKQFLPESDSVTYRAFGVDTFNEELVDAIAAGEGPDVFILDHQDIIQQSNKIYITSYESYTQRRFKDMFVEGAEIFLHPEGILAFPLSVDPLVMYWNRDILAQANIPTVPEYWDEFFLLSPKLVKRDQGANIQQSSIAFGEYRNVTNAKEIVSALIMQAGDPILERAVTGGAGEYRVGLGRGGDGAASALRFYTEFSNPIKSVYSWNRALPESRRAFIAGDLAFYFGHASEIQEIRRLNPNLNFDLAPLPQVRDDETPLTFGAFKGVAILKTSDNFAGAFKVASGLATNPVIETYAQQAFLPPISRQLLAERPTDDVMPVFYEGALLSRAWLEPDPVSVDVILRDMIESISSGRLSISAAVAEASEELEQLVSR